MPTIQYNITPPIFIIANDSQISPLSDEKCHT